LGQGVAKEDGGLRVAADLSQTNPERKDRVVELTTQVKSLFKKKGGCGACESLIYSVPSQKTRRIRGLDRVNRTKGEGGDFCAQSSGK